MENRKFYEALKGTIERLKANDVYDRMKFSFRREFEKQGFKNIGRYHETVNYKKIFLKIFYDCVYSESEATDFDGKDTSNIETATTIVVMERQMQKMDETGEIYTKYRRNHLTLQRYREILEEYDLW